MKSALNATLVAKALETRNVLAIDDDGFSKHFCGTNPKLTELVRIKGFVDDEKFHRLAVASGADHAVRLIFIMLILANRLN